MMVVVRNIAISVWEWFMRFRSFAPRTRFEAAVFEAIHAFVRRISTRGVVVIHGAS